MPTVLIRAGRSAHNWDLAHEGSGSCLGHRWLAFAVASALSASACDRPAPELGPTEPPTSGVTIRDSAGIRIVENHAPVWGPDDFWTVDPEPELVLGGLGHLRIPGT